jgi:hypothetical protein
MVHICIRKQCKDSPCIAILILTSKNSSVLLINVYTLSSTKLEISAKQFLPGSEQVVGERERAGEKEGLGERGKEMTQTLHAHMNKRNLKKRK